jgi:hypothetical protein
MGDRKVGAGRGEEVHCGWARMTRMRIRERGRKMGVEKF